MRTLAPIGSALVLVACVHPTPVKAPMPTLPALSVPVPVIASVCDQAHPEQGSGRWDGGAHLLWSKDGSSVVAIECTLTVMVDGLSTAVVRVYLSDARAQALRDFLNSRGY